MIDITENKPKWWPREKQQGLMIRVLSNIFGWRVEQKPQQIPARALSISTG